MNALYLFISTFCVVFALGLQSQLVNNGYWKGAMVNSFLIGASNLVLFKLAPSADGWEIAGYLTGGPLGIVASMAVFKAIRGFDKVFTYVMEDAS
jgi:hypothetical protein